MFSVSCFEFPLLQFKPNISCPSGLFVHEKFFSFGGVFFPFLYCFWVSKDFQDSPPPKSSLDGKNSSSLS